ncbi:sulfur carrier protein ThiS [Persicimonas caeni]|uniref:Sulfur carrier protein ThiS n=1 Tax=Persicimonas caeni TaxID=2292766 RepID=A0A4Y6PUN0_PERCE|nr:sulfur carrier protein ThiS [Persicimonas caeni]QDG52032.1 sulfur carrier protein ThiS [Persicimonas caeni]QED33253.1 sulfur carrier protein ThiS [Persicimonas caeni]
MKLQLNGEPKTLDSDTLTVAELLAHLDITQRRGVAIAVNNSVVPKSEWDDHQLDDDDAVEIIRATQGG